MRCAALTFTCLLAVACVSAEAPQSAGAPPPAFDGTRAFAHVERLVAIGPRPAGSEGAARTREYVKQQLSALGLAPVEQAFEADTPAGRLNMVNVSAIVPAQGRPTGPRLVIAGHYDTKRFSEFAFVGANDGGSSTGFLIELARVLKDRKNALPIELLFLDGEEAIGEWATGNTFGSRYYVDAARKAGTVNQIKAMILVDMIGDRDLTIKRERQSTPWLVDVIWSVARGLKRPEFLDASTEVIDDHVPFLEAGIPSVDIIDFQYPDDGMGYWHTAEDTLDKVSAASLQTVGDVLLAALPAVELRVR